MRKFFAWLLLAILPVLMTGTSFALIADTTLKTPLGTSINISVPRSIINKGFNIYESKFNDIENININEHNKGVLARSATFIALPDSTPQTTKELLIMNAQIGSLNAKIDLLQQLEDIWIPADFPISEQMRNNAINANSLVIQFEDLPSSDIEKSYSTSKIPPKLAKILVSKTIYTFNKQGKLIGTNVDELVTIGGEPTPETRDTDEAYNKADLKVIIDITPEEPKFIRTPLEFEQAEVVRAHTNINGIDFVGPPIFTSFDKALSPSEKKMAAAYALIGQVISSRLFFITGHYDERTTLQIPDSSALFSRRSGDARESGTFLGQETDLIDYTGTSTDGTFQFRTIVEKIIDFMKRIMIPIAVLLVAYSGIELFLSFQNEEKMKDKVNQITGILVGFLTMMLAVNLVDWIVFGNEGQILSGEVDVAEFARRGFTEVSGLFDFFTTFAVIIAVAFIVFNSITLILAGGEDESQISSIKKRILYSLIGLILMISIRPLLDVFTSGGQLVMPEVRGTVTIVAKWINFILGFIGLFAVVSMVYAGIMMIAHFGDDSQVENAKKIMTSAAIGLILAFSSWVVVYYFVFAGQV